MLNRLFDQFISLLPQHIDFLQGIQAHTCRMKFENKTEPVCTVLIAVPAYTAIVIITGGTGVNAQDVWFPLSLVVTILAIGITNISSK